MSVQVRLTTSFCAIIISLLLSACATTRPELTGADSRTSELWLSSVLGYEQTLNPNHPDRIENMFAVSDEIRDRVRIQFSKGTNSQGTQRQGTKHQRARALANWLINEDGHDMAYDLEANFVPDQAFYERRGNCLSFTILLVTLANNLGIELKYNDVDLPSMWDLDEQAGYVFYRHVNAIFKTPHYTQVFDLAMQDYDAGFPQRTISQRAAGALLHSNLGVEALKAKDFEEAFHHLRLAASIDPSNSDLWINLGAAYKRNKQLGAAENAFKMAISLDDKNSLAASNLERLYRDQSRVRLAERYQRLAARARLDNPYVQYRNANTHFQNNELRLAKKSIKRAIKLHDLDPRFFELSSRINQRLRNYKPALLDLEKAFKLAKDVDERSRYYDKVKLVAAWAEKEAEKERERRAKRRNDQDIIIVNDPSIRF